MSGAALLAHLHLYLKQGQLLPTLLASRHLTVPLCCTSLELHATLVKSRPAFLTHFYLLSEHLCACAVASLLLSGSKAHPVGLWAPSAASLSLCIQLSSAI